MSARKDRYLQATVRFDHYFKGYHLWRVVAFFAIAVSSLLSIALASMIFLLSPKPVFFPVGASGEIIPYRPLSSPNISDARLRAWVIAAVTECSTFGPHDYKLRLEQCRKYFSDEGFDGYIKALAAPGAQIRERIIGDQQVLSAEASGSPVIVEKSVQGAAILWWKVEIPVTTTFEKGDQSRTTSQLVQLVISRLESSERLSGIGITQWRQKNVP